MLLKVAVSVEIIIFNLKMIYDYLFLFSNYFQRSLKFNESATLQKIEATQDVQESDSTDHFSADFVYKNSPILKIIHKLFERLGWPSNGILDGKIPKVNPNSIDTQIESREDDGEFVYCLLRNPDFLNPLHDPYDLIPATVYGILKVNVYFTISATYVSKVS